jgi:hypothetical protein
VQRQERSRQLGVPVLDDPLRMTGPYDYDRLLACEFVPDVLRRARGMIAPNLPARARLSRIVHDMIGDGPAIMQPA